MAFYFVNLVKNQKVSKYANIVEIGANDGCMMCDFIQGIFNFSPELLHTLKFNIIEPHKKLQELQSQNFKNSFSDSVNITHFSDLSECNFDEAFFMSNELFDSFDCEIVDGDKMLFVDDKGGLFWDKIDDFTALLCQKNQVKKGEISLGFEDFSMSIRKAANRARFISFDYGENFIRNDFSVRIFKEHKVYNLFEIDDLRAFFGVSDITYNVNFSHLKSAFSQAGFINTAYKKQGLALVDMGILEILQIAKQNGGESAYRSFLKQFKFLFNPEFLGDKFKMIEFEI